jgi:hypothetical protein
METAIVCASSLEVHAFLTAAPSEIKNFSRFSRSFIERAQLKLRLMDSEATKLQSLNDNLSCLLTEASEMTERREFKERQGKETAVCANH